MKTFAEINKIMFDNEFDKDGNKCNIITEIRYDLLESSDQRNLTYQQADLLEYCGITEDEFVQLCSVTEDAYLAKDDDPCMTISRLAWAVVQLFNKGKLNENDLYSVYEVAAKYSDQWDDEE